MPARKSENTSSDINRATESHSGGNRDSGRGASEVIARLEQELKEAHREIASYKHAAARVGEQLAEITRLNQALERSELETALILDSTSDAMWLLDRERRVIWANAAMAELMGCEADDLRGRRCSDCFRIPQCGTDLCPHKRVLECGERVTIEEIHIEKKKVETSCFVTASPLRDNRGEIIGVLEDLIDITRLKEIAETLDIERRQLLSIFDSIDEPVYVTDPESYEVLYCNKAAEAMFGDMVGQSCYRALQGLDSPCSFCTNDKIFGENFGKTYIWEHHNQNKKRWYRCFDRAIAWPDGRIARYEMAIDITESKLLEQEVLRTQKLESLAVLAGGIAHDFNNLLTGVLANVSVALKLSEGQDELRDILESSEKASIRAQELTQQLLTFSRGGEPIKKESSLAPLVVEAVEFGLRGSNVRPEFEFPKELPALLIDEGQITQVINNLVLNAREAMPTGGTLKVTLHSEHCFRNNNGNKTSGPMLVLTISDQGCGIPTELFDKIFDPFFTTKTNGRGLGLSVCHSIILNHNGTLTVKSIPDQGTTFTIAFPALDHPAPRPRTGNTPVPEAHHGKRILVMDDELYVRRAARTILRYLGYEVEVTRDGEEALERYKEALNEEKPFDLVVMDLTVPGGMGGRETLERLIEIAPDVRAIVASGYSNDPVMSDHKRFGFRSVVTKPFRMEDLARAVDLALDKSDP